jgi:putative ABC transport system permease protein
MVLVELFLPTFNSLAERELELNFGQDQMVLLGLASIALIVGIVSGSYPAFYLSAFRPVDVLKGKMTVRNRGRFFNRGLVVFQFVVSITLMLATGIIYSQLSFMRNDETGFDKDGVVVFQDAKPERWTYRYLKNKLLQHPDIVNVTVSTSVPGRLTLDPFRHFRVEGGKRSDFVDCWSIAADDDFVKTLGMELIDGRYFREDSSIDAGTFIINEEAARQFGWENPIGRRLESNPVQMMGSNKSPRQLKGEIIGVIEDFHLESLHHPIEPVIIRAGTGNLISVKIKNEKIAEVMPFLEEKIRDFSPSFQVQLFFLNDELDRQYREENRLFLIFGSFTLMGIFVSYLGIFGLATFTAERRTKEIGLRKVLGASVASIISLLSKEFSKLVITANLLAWPIAYFAMARWLQNFTYRINLGPGVFLLGGLIALVIALLTVSVQAIKAALSNPVDALRYE